VFVFPVAGQENLEQVYVFPDQSHSVRYPSGWIANGLGTTNQLCLFSSVNAIADFGFEGLAVGDAVICMNLLQQSDPSISSPAEILEARLASGVFEALQSGEVQVGGNVQEVGNPGVYAYGDFAGQNETTDTILVIFDVDGTLVEARLITAPDGLQAFETLFLSILGSFGQAGSTFTYTADDGSFSLEIPIDWQPPFNGAAEGYSLYTANHTGLNMLHPTRGQVDVVFSSWSTWSNSSTTLDEVISNARQRGLSAQMMTIGQHQVVRIERVDYHERIPSWATVTFVLQAPSGTFYELSMSTVYDEMAQFEPTVQAIVASIQFASPANPVDSSSQPPESSTSTGGIQILLRSELPSNMYTPDDFRLTANVIEQRLTGLGYEQPTVQVASEQTILVVIPYATDVQDVIRTIQPTGLLEFVNLSGMGNQATSLIGQRILTSEWALILDLWAITESERETFFGEPLLLHPITNQPFDTIITGSAFQSAEQEYVEFSSRDENNWFVTLEFKPEGEAIFEAFTAANIGQPIGIVFDGVVTATPIIQSPIADKVDLQAVDFLGGGNGTDSGEELATRLAILLRYGALPIPLLVETVEVVEDLGNSPSSDNQFSFRILEGWRIEEIAQAIDANPQFGFSGADFLAVVGVGAPQDPSFVQFVGLPAGASLEGFLFPNTYQLSADVTAEMLRDVLIQEFQTQISTQLVQEANAQGWSLFEVVSLASIVQREAVHPDEYPLIASVYRNRLNIGMKLDADPTVQYALGLQNGTWWSPITQDDHARVVSPYNTYLYGGLPPAPIASPGLSAIEAVIRPQQTDYFYLRLRPDGSGYHSFYSDYESFMSAADGINFFLEQLLEENAICTAVASATLRRDNYQQAIECIDSVLSDLSHEESLLLGQAIADCGVGSGRELLQFLVAVRNGVDPSMAASVSFTPEQTAQCVSSAAQLFDTSN
jgi:uncharacterized YceG family protein